MTGLVYDKRYLLHDAGEGHPERPGRLEAVMRGLGAAGLTDSLLLIAPSPAEMKWLEEIHSPGYMAEVKKLCSEGRPYIHSLDNGISKESFDTALLAAGGALDAVDAVIGGRVKNAFCAVRPPGHHALPERAMGFCLFNNAAIAARFAQKKHGLKKVLIVDWDVHHGNGTQEVFYNDPNVMYFSAHRHPHYPGTGGKGEKGSGDAEGTNINVPLPSGSGDGEYIRVFLEILRPAALRFRPDFMIISAGFDAHKDDPLGGMEVTAEGFGKLTENVLEIADETSSGRVVSILEGGYGLEGLARSAAAHVAALAGMP